ncbi:MAG TPA: UDP-3-O-acyl-N-acetylglucosamine deacetylase [Hyphomonadaceae bacterium]|nr:UDP-3-O-acyl-N-acetylglucosamine deacetylase [Hyphomonadaceae bacterium]
MESQHTIAREASRSGPGVHSGKAARLVIRPAAAGEGVAFIRSDLGGARIPASALAAETPGMGTNLNGEGGASVATVEHFLAACAGAGIDNLVAELDGPELPILDGSSKNFVELIEEAGLAAQSAPRKRLKILKPVEVRDGVKFARLSPHEGFAASIVIDFGAGPIGRQALSFAMTPGSFAREIAWARTFGFARDAEAARAAGKALGASLDNTIVVDGDAIRNPGGLRAPDEFVRHKMLDVIGDMFLAGGPIDGLYEAEQPGHLMNNRLLREVFGDPSAFAWTSA